MIPGPVFRNGGGTTGIHWMALRGLFHSAVQPNPLDNRRQPLLNTRGKSSSCFVSSS
jgi:hypothetical protein